MEGPAAEPDDLLGIYGLQEFFYIRKAIGERCAVGHFENEVAPGSLPAHEAAYLCIVHQSLSSCLCIRVRQAGHLLKARIAAMSTATGKRDSRVYTDSRVVVHAYRARVCAFRHHLLLQRPVRCSGYRGSQLVRLLDYWHLLLKEQLMDVAGARGSVVEVRRRDESEVFVEVVPECKGLGDGGIYIPDITAIEGIRRVDEPRALGMNSELCATAALVEDQTLGDTPGKDLSLADEHGSSALEQTVLHIPVLVDYLVHLMGVFWSPRGVGRVQDELLIPILFSSGWRLHGLILSQ